MVHTLEQMMHIWSYYRMCHPAHQWLPNTLPREGTFRSPRTPPHILIQAVLSLLSWVNLVGPKLVRENGPTLQNWNSLMMSGGGCIQFDFTPVSLSLSLSLQKLIPSLQRVSYKAHRETPPHHASALLPKSPQGGSRVGLCRQTH